MGHTGEQFLAMQEFEQMQVQQLRKSLIAQKATRTVDNILERGNPITTAITIKAVEEFIEAIKKDKRFIDYVREELAKNGGKDSVEGIALENVEAGTKYDYSNDPVWVDLDKKKRDRETFLKTIKDPLSIVNEETGEVYSITPPVKTSSSTYKITLQK